MQIILASKSPYRKKALEILGLDFEVHPSNIDEKGIRDVNPYRLAKTLSEQKALSVCKNFKNAIIIASDLFVVHEGRIYEKPNDEKEASSMLKTFSNSYLDIVAGLAVYNTNTEKMLSTSEKYTVKFRELTDYEINDYITKYPVLECAASFESEGELRFAESTCGKYPFLTSLPMNELILFLRKNGIRV
jgi:septum formation protein